MEFIGGQNLAIPSHIFHPCNALSEHHSFEPCVHLIAQRMLIGRAMLAIVNIVITPCFLAVKYNGITV